MSFVGVLRRGLLATFVIAAVLLAIRAFAGPYFAVNSPMNVEAIAAASAMLLWSLNQGEKRELGVEPFEIPLLWCIALITVVVVANFYISLSFPLIFDDYVHLTAVRRAGASFWLDQFTIPATDHFFRPLGMYDLRIDAGFANKSATLWRLGNLFWHVANCVLVFFFGRRLGLARWTAVVAAILFGIHGSRPESAGWVAARFDLMATCFLLVSFLLIYRAVDRTRDGAQIALLSAAFVSGVAGLLSKEAAYAWPLLVTLLFYRRLPLRILAIPYILTAVAFLYRWRVLSGIGGYQTGDQPDILVFSLARTAKALFMRLWATLWFPVNWTHSPSALSATLLVLMLGVVAWLCWNRAVMHWRALAFVLLAALPVQHLLLIGPEMEKSRVLYLPSVGFAILIGWALQTVPNARGAMVAGVAILAFQMTILQHNFAIWGRVAELGRTACIELGQAAMQQPSGTISVTGLPRLRDGVYFLGNGVVECVEWHTGVDALRVHVVGGVPLEGETFLRWDESTLHFVRVR